MDNFIKNKYFQVANMSRGKPFVRNIMKTLFYIYQYHIKYCLRLSGLNETL